MHIKVLQHHIDEGVQSDPYSCPIARAIKEQHPEIQSVVVHGWIILDGYLWETPKEAMKFISHYDGNHGRSYDNIVHPFGFDLKDELRNRSSDIFPGGDMYDSTSG